MSEPFTITVDNHSITIDIYEFEYKVLHNVVKKIDELYPNMITKTPDKNSDGVIITVKEYLEERYSKIDVFELMFNFHRLLLDELTTGDYDRSLMSFSYKEIELLVKKYVDVMFNYHNVDGYRYISHTREDD